LIVPLIDLHAQYLELKKEILKATERVFDSGVYISGPEVEALEKDIAFITHSQYAVSNANGTDALVLALDACGVGPGDEVITTPYTFFATAEAIVRRGAIPVFADIDERTYNLSPEETEKKITSKTKAIIPVHIFGQPADMDAFNDIAERHNLAIIEDACQALGAGYKGKPIGALGTIGCVSFFPTKNLGGYGDGGIVVTNDEELADRIRLLSHHGSKRKYYHDVVGYNSRLDPLQAAILRVKLGKLQEWNAKRQQKAAFYAKHLEHTTLRIPIVDANVDHVFHLYAVECDKREQLADQLQQAGISTGHYYPCPLHLQKALAYLGYKPGDFKVTEKVCERSLALPMSPHLTEEQQVYIIEKVQQLTKV
jgi:dTDP-4-amino-4,6-dideoxygalactose transaminase